LAAAAGKETEMAILTRRSVLRGSVGLAATGALARPHIANAATTTAELWWVQGFAQEEDVAFKKVLADYEKASGNKIELSIMPFAPQRQKIVSAVTSGIVPDFFPNNPAEIIALYAWDDKLVDVTDIVETRREEYTETALLNTYCYNNVTKTRSFYGVPYTTATLPNHVWRPLVEKAGYKIEDIPKTWDAYYDFFKEVQKKLRAQGVRNVYGLGLNTTTNGVDPNNVFNYFLIAYGGQDVVTKDGKLHLDDPKVREAAIKALTYPATAYKEGFVPPGAINWNDADDNNAFHAKQIVMDLDGTISTEVAVLSQGKKDDYDDIVTMGLALSNDGKPVPSHANNGCGLIPKGAKNVAVAKDFLSRQSRNQTG
jgi:multiple sugar transport system substrate-binding protein